MTNPKELFDLAMIHPDELNLEGKQSFVMELVEFMTEKQCDEIINQMRLKYKCKEVK